MHHSGEFPDEPSRFKLPPSLPEGPAEQAELRGLFFASIEEAMDLAAGYEDVAAFRQQLRYARLLSAIGEDARAGGQLGLALAAAEAGAAQAHAHLEIVEAPEFLREQAVALVAVAAALSATGREEQAEPLITEVSGKLEQALTTENTPGPHISDTFRSIREPSAVLEVAGNLADMGMIRESEAWRSRALMTINNYDMHMEVLERQKRAAGEDAPEAGVPAGLQIGIMLQVKASLKHDLEEETGGQPVTGVADIVELHKTSENYAQDVTVNDLLDAYAAAIRTTASATEQERAYRELGDAYELVDDMDQAYLARSRALRFIRKRLREGRIEALEDLAIVELKMRDDEAAERVIPEIALRYRLGVRREQARLAIADKDPAKAVCILDTAMNELDQRFATAGKDEDEFEAAMGLAFTAMYGQVGEYDRMDGAYAMLERHNESLGPWGGMMISNASAHPPIAGHFLAGGRVGRAFDAIRNADDGEQIRFLIDLMETMCDPQHAVEAMVIDRAELTEALRKYIAYQEEERER